MIGSATLGSVSIGSTCGGAAAASVPSWVTELRDSLTELRDGRGDVAQMRIPIVDEDSDNIITGLDLDLVTFSNVACFISSIRDSGNQSIGGYEMDPQVTVTALLADMSEPPQLGHEVLINSRRYRVETVITPPGSAFWRAELSTPNR